MNKIVLRDVLNLAPMCDEMKKYSMIISGTFLLSLYGLMDSFGDIDIIVEDMDEDFFDYLNIWCNANNIEHERIEGNGEDYYSSKVTHDKYTYNFLDGSENNVPETFLKVTTTDGYDFYLDTLDHALKAKMSLGRVKDFKHLNQMIKTIAKY